MNQKPVKQQLGVGYDTAIITEETWIKIGMPKMGKNYCKAQGALGATLRIKGVNNCEVALWGEKKL